MATLAGNDHIGSSVAIQIGDHHVLGAIYVRGCERHQLPRGGAGSSKSNAYVPAVFMDRNHILSGIGIEIAEGKPVATSDLDAATHVTNARHARII